MWGNLHGWLISAVLAAIIIAPLLWLAQMSRMSAPADVGADPNNLRRIALPVDPDDAWPIFTDDAYAADSYMRLIDTWDIASERACEDFVRMPTDQTPAPLQVLIDVRHHKRMELFSGDLSSLINYKADHPRLKTLFDCGEWCYKAGLSLHVHGHSKEAEPFLEGAFALGRHLYRERLIFDEYQCGTRLMDDSAVAMVQTVTKGSELYDQLSDFHKQFTEYQENHVLPIWAVLGSVNQEVINRTAGDVQAFAGDSAEPMWRVEAVLKLGRYKYDAGTLGDQIGAARAVRRLTQDRDPTVAMAAVEARDLTVESYRMIH